MKKSTYYLLTIKGYSIRMKRFKTIAKVRRLIKLGKVYDVTQITKNKRSLVFEQIYRDSKSQPLNKIKT